MDLISINKAEIIEGIEQAELLPFNQPVFIIDALNKQVLKGKIKAFFYAQCTLEINQLGIGSSDGVFYVVSTETLTVQNIKPFTNVFFNQEKDILLTPEAVENRINKERAEGAPIGYCNALTSSLAALINPPANKEQIINYNELFHITEIESYQDFIQDLNNIAKDVKFCLIPRKGVVKEIFVMNSECDCTHDGFIIEKYLEEKWNGEGVPRLRFKEGVSIGKQALPKMIKRDYVKVSFYTAMKEINYLKENAPAIVGSSESA